MNSGEKLFSFEGLKKDFIEIKFAAIIILKSHLGSDHGCRPH
jgi:hypothetical protein